MDLANKKYVDDKWLIPTIPYYDAGTIVRNDFTYSLDIPDRYFVMLEMIWEYNGESHSVSIVLRYDNLTFLPINNKINVITNNGFLEMEYNLSFSGSTINWSFKKLSEFWKQKVWAWGYAYKEPVDLFDISRSINYFKDQQLFLPIASQSFVDSYSHTINWETFRYDTSKLQPNYGESTKYHSVICQQSFTADVKVTFDKEDDNGNPYQVSYFIFENEMEMKRIDQTSSFNKFDWTERINFVAGNYYTFRVYGTPSVGGGYFIENLTFSIKEI